MNKKTSVQDFVSRADFELFADAFVASTIAENLIGFLDEKWVSLCHFDSMGYKTMFTDLWGKLVVGGEGELAPHEKKWLIEDILSLDVAIGLGLTKKDLTIEQKYDQFCAWANSGFIAKSAITSDHRECVRSGVNITPVFLEPFNVTLHRRNPQTHQLEAVAPYVPPGVQHAKFNCPSGEIIIADWIRIPELTDLYRKNQDHSHEYSINHEAGSIADTKRTLEKFGMLDIHLSNIAVETYRRDGVLLIGDSWDLKQERNVAPFGYKSMGSICADRWSFAAIDRATLEKLLAPLTESPKDTIDEYIKESGALVQQWTPGEYHVYFSGNHEVFRDEFTAIDFDLPEYGQVYAVISEHELPFKCNAKPKRKACM